MCCHNGRRLALQRRDCDPPINRNPACRKYYEGGDSMDVIDFLAIIGYTVTIFSIGYTFGKDFARKQK